jgi:sulfhydrogenase subunit alpha
MHVIDINLDRISKVEGAASLAVRVNDDKVESVKFSSTEYKRFYTKAMEGKPLLALPQLLARICGTCSNAHLMCSIEAGESALGIVPSEQTRILRRLTLNGLMIRDHALHLYLFVMPDIFGKDAFLDFDEGDPVEHQMLHDGFEIKAAGNKLALLVAGRSVHAMYPTLGGFLRFPEAKGVDEVRAALEATRPAVIRLVEFFAKAPFHLNRKTNYVALLPQTGFGFLGENIHSSTGQVIAKADFRKHFEHTVLPYSQASAYKSKGEPYMVGALARLNLAADRLHANTKKDAAAALKKFPSYDIFDNNLAQALEILHCLDESLDLLQSTKFVAEPPIKAQNREAVGIGVIEAPRGTLYHKVVVGADGIVKSGEVVIPTGQNQINLEQDVFTVVSELVAKKTPKDEIVFELEKLIRAYDPCMSCASHFLKVKWTKAV